jgi:hypothetical protein
MINLYNYLCIVFVVFSIIYKLNISDQAYIFFYAFSAFLMSISSSITALSINLLNYTILAIVLRISAVGNSSHLMDRSINLSILSPRPQIFFIT